MWVFDDPTDWFVAGMIAGVMLALYVGLLALLWRECRATRRSRLSRRRA